MNDERLAWLLRCATRLRGEERGAVDLEGILARFGVDVQSIGRSKTAPAPTGLLGRKPNGDFVIGVNTGEPALLWRPRDRFTIAHELGHLLLVRKWNYAPPSGQRREYFACETLCNRFAGHLLVDRRALPAGPALHAEACLERVCGLARRFDVSMEVAAREFVQAYPGTMVCAVQALRGGAGAQILWGVASWGGLCQTRGRFFKDALPAEAGFRWYEKSVLNRAKAPPDACVRHWYDGRSLAVLVCGDDSARTAGSAARSS